jgi:hypothetical protein
MALREYKGSARSTYSTVALTGSDMLIQTEGLTGWPDGQTGPFFAVINRQKSNEEKVLCESQNGSDLIILQRGADETAPQSHAVGSVVEHVITATDAREANEHVNDANLHIQAGNSNDRPQDSLFPGQMYYETDTKILWIYGSDAAWHASTAYPRLEENLNMQGTLRVVNLADGVQDQDAVTKKQLDVGLDAAAGSTVDAGTTYTIAAGEDADVKNVGTKTDAVFDFYIPQGPKGDRGEDGTDATATSIILSTALSQDLWPADGNFTSPPFEKAVQAQTGDSVWYNLDGGQLWLFTADSTTPWTAMPMISGPPGVDGEPGEDGVDGLPGENGADGADGKSAYEIAVENGFIGTEEEWLDSLKFGGENYLELAGGTMQGPLVAKAIDHSQFQARNIKVSSLAPTTADGADGDIWFQVGSAP